MELIDMFVPQEMEEGGGDEGGGWLNRRPILRHSHHVKASVMRERLPQAYDFGTLPDFARQRSFMMRRRSSNKKLVTRNVADLDDGDEYSVRLYSSASCQKSSHYARFTPGKVGGVFLLPLGGQISIPKDLFKKRETITCRVVLPHDRYKYEPIVRTRDDKVISEIFHIYTSGCTLKKVIQLSLPHLKAEDELREAVLLCRENGDRSWQTINTLAVDPEKPNEDYVLFETMSADAVYVVVSSPKCERFDVPVSGCLYTAKINRIITIRFPKSAAAIDMSCGIQIIRLSLQDVPQHLVQDIVTRTDVIRILPSVLGELRRPASVKLPLPPTSADQPFSLDDLAVYQMTASGTWSVIETTMRFTKNSVAFDTKLLTQFCVVVSKPGRKARICDVLKLAYDRMQTFRGDIVPFFRLDGKIWTVWFDCFRSDKLQLATEHVTTKLGLQVVYPTSHLPKPTSAAAARAAAAASAKRPSRTSLTSENGGSRTSPSDQLILSSGTTFELDIGGDLQTSSDYSHDGGSDDVITTTLTYHERLEHNYRRFEVVPRSSTLVDGRTMTGVLRVYTLGTPADALVTQSGAEPVRKCVRTYDFDVDPGAVEEFYYVEPEPEPVVEDLPDIEVEDIVPMDKTPTFRMELEKPKRDYQAAIESFERLTRHTKPVLTGVSKEVKVLSGRSLKCLSTMIEKGIGLAMYLNMTESAVTGLTFDSMANHLSRSEITYRLLLQWKRRTSTMARDRQVEMLVNALESIGQTKLSRVVAECHSRKEEITEDCLRSKDDSTDISSTSESPPVDAFPQMMSLVNDDNQYEMDTQYDNGNSVPGSAINGHNAMRAFVNDGMREGGGGSIAKKTRIVEFRLPSISQ